MNTKYKKQFYSNGFTLIETLVAVLILTMSVGGLLALAAGGFYSVRYARNQIVANNLLQESLEYIRNTKDSASIGAADYWSSWQDQLQVDANGNQTGNDTDGCFNTNGCIVNPYVTSAKIKQCGASCPYILYYDNGFYGYEGTYPGTFVSGSSTYQTSFVRKITIAPSTSNPDQVVVTGTISWLNGTNPKTISQNILLTKWSP